VAAAKAARRRALPALGVLLAAAASPDPALAVPTVCTAQNVIALDPSCPATGFCTIAKDFEIGDGCVLDFGTRDVTISGHLNLDSRTGTIKAGSLTLAPSGFIEGRGTKPKPNDVGGTVIIDVLGNLTMLSQGNTVSRINVSGNAGGGSISISALGTATIGGKIRADNSTSAADGGEVVLRTGSDILVAGSGEITANGGSAATGGEIDLGALGRVQVDTSLDVSGGEGGSVDVSAEEDVVLAVVKSDGAGDGGSGGAVTVIAGTGVELKGDMSSRGADGSFGGSGGFVLIDALYGDIHVTAPLHVEGAQPDGVGGDVVLGARGTIKTEIGGMLSARANGSQSSGGSFTIDADLDVNLLGPVDVSGGFTGGLLEATGGRAVAMDDVAANARAAGGLGGSVIGTAGIGGYGPLDVTGLIDVSAAGCDQFFCSAAGEIELSGCNVTIANGAELSANATAGGRITLLGYEQITLSAPMHAIAASAKPIDAGMNRFVYRLGHPPVVTVAPTPPAVETAAATCTAPGQAGCLEPCPVCGNGVVEFPETCDTVGTPLSCDGCSRFCVLETCDDSSTCTSDSCTPQLGCRFDPLPDGTPCASGSCEVGVCVETPTTTTTTHPPTTTTTTTKPATTSTSTTSTTIGQPTTTTTVTTPGTTTTTVTTPATTSTTVTQPTTTTTHVTATTTTTGILPTTTTAPPPTTVPATTVTTSTAPTLTPTSTTSTTTLEPSCDSFPGVKAVRCRLDRFEAMFTEANVTGTVANGVRSRLRKIRLRLDQADVGGKKGRRALKQARAQLTELGRYLRQNKKKLGVEVAGALQTAVLQAGQQLAPLLSAGS
jgi:cysteine-rich repeat protein